MAAIPEARGHLAQQRAVAALLCFLQIRHSPLQKRPEIAAAERLQQRTAIALSRLCSDATVAKQVVELQGINRLVRLCKEGRERNHSDGVLVACLVSFGFKFFGIKNDFCCRLRFVRLKPIAGLT